MWSLHDIAQITNGRLSSAASPNTAIHQVVIDSKAVTSGCLFVALPGAKVDGHDFLQDVFAKGAAAALVHKTPSDDAWPVIQVANTDLALWDLAAAAVERHQGIRIGITGSAGKTTTKDMLAIAMEQATGAPVFRTHSSFNSLRGLPVTLCNLPADAPYAIVELGMNQPGEISRLTRLLKPHAALITCITEAHLEAVGSREGIAHEKLSIIQGLDPKTGLLVIPDAPELLKRGATAYGLQTIRTFGEASQNDAHLVSYTPEGLRSTATADIEGTSLTYTLPALGRHLACNSLAVLEMVHLLGLPLAPAAQGLAGAPLPAGRGQVYARLYHGTPFTLVDESYNAHPTSMRTTLQVFRERPLPKGAKRIVVLGAMGELGPEGPALHAAMAPFLPVSEITSVITVGALMKHLFEALTPSQRVAHVDTAEEVLPLLMPLIGPGDLVFLKGSLSTRLVTLIPQILTQTEAAPEAQETLHALHPVV